ncbi:hypothetical protein [Actinoallomurus sp. NPDC050550]|uniref:hypothetical protein n=1 Tax=Actinoallomurus sp. NPDC050550 TaxID=3154937 RepID=UPI0033EC3D82
MTGPDATTTTNTAGGSAYVGMQAGTVHGDVKMYMLPPDASPEQKFETGVRCLNGNMPDQARELIHEAAMAEYVNDRVCFYRLLAVMSGRTRHELSKEEAAMLWGPQKIRPTTCDEWAGGIKVIHDLLETAQDPESDINIPLTGLDKLGDIQRTMIIKHMEAFLDGPIEDKIWAQSLRQAAQEQMDGDRMDRVWKFFQAKPLEPREHHPEPITIPITTRVQAVVATALFVVATAHLGYLLAEAGRVFALLAYLLSIAGGYFGARDGVEWRFRTVRRHAKDLKYRTAHHRRTNTSPDGFAKKVDQRFEYYFAKFAPRGAERQFWLADTAGVRRTIRDEIVEEYREQRVGVERINWLIRHRSRVVRERWDNDTLWDYRRELATPLRAKTTTLLGLATLVGAGIWAVASAIQVGPLSTVRSTILALACGWLAARAWLHILLERRRHAADRAESRRTWDDDKEKFVRWQATLADKPDDGEMAAWLDCDRKVLLNEALQHYQLTMSNVIAYAFIEAPTASTKRARVLGGPWRYTKYKLLVFLLTTDGVRQLTVKLDFKRATFHDRKRTNYRYEAVAAVWVDHSDDGERTFELALINGQEIRVQVIGPGMEQLEQGEAPGTISKATLDAAGLRHTLHVLEGIAAEGKEWIIHEDRRGEARTGNLTAAVQGEASS